MFRFPLLLIGLLCLTAIGHAQCSTCQNGVVFVNNTNHNGASVVFRTGFSDVACAGGICLVPGGHGGYNLQNFGHHQHFGHGFGHHNNIAVIPQSTAFFALSNPNVFQFRTREFIQVPHTNAIVTTDSYGNEIILNAGIHSGISVQSRGQTIFVR